MLGFKTMPATTDQPIRFAIGGDVRHNKSWMVRTNQVAMSHQPRFIVWGGGLAYANADPKNMHLWKQWFEACQETPIDDAGFVTPIVVGIGNHDAQHGYYRNHDGFEPTNAWRKRIAPYFNQFFAFPGQPGYNTLDLAQYFSFIILDTDHSNPMEGKQTRWLEQARAQCRHVTNVLPVYHIPAFPSHRDCDGGTSTFIREHWLPLFEKYGVRAAFENHDHAYKRTPPAFATSKSIPKTASPTSAMGPGAWVHASSTMWRKPGTSNGPNPSDTPSSSPSTAIANTTKSIPKTAT